MVLNNFKDFTMMKSVTYYGKGLNELGVRLLDNMSTEEDRLFTDIMMCNVIDNNIEVGEIFRATINTTIKAYKVKAYYDITVLDKENIIVNFNIEEIELLF